jgi:flagellar protein FliL
MPIEQRVISGGGQKIGGKSSGSIGAKDAPAAEPETTKKSKKGLLIAILAVLLVAGGAAAYFFLGMGGGSAAAEPEPEPTHEPGAVVTVEPISLNLADGHYLRLGFALQLTADVGEESPDTSKAIDMAIELFSGRTVAEISDPTSREALKVEFAAELAEAYEGEVMDVYLTNYVTQ